jgi:hypothetical protein
VSFKESCSFSFLNRKGICGRESAVERDGDGGNLGVGTEGVAGRSRSNRVGAQFLPRCFAISF